MINTQKRYLLSPLAAAITMLLYGGTALAQDQKDDQEFEGALEEVIVTGVKYSMTEAVEVKRNSMSVVDSIVSEDLGKFPDDNVVEAMPSRIMPANSPWTAGSSV